MNKGFTLLELLIVIAIIGLLASAVLVTYPSATGKARLANTLQWAGSMSHLLGANAVGIWTFDNISGAIVYDDSGMGNNGTINKGANGTGCDVVDGVMGKAMSFDGVDDYVTTTNISSNSFTESYTFSLWTKLNAFGDSRSNCGSKRAIFIAKEVGTNGIQFMSVTGDKIQFGHSGTPGGRTVTSGALNTNEWIHAMVVYNQSIERLKLYYKW